MVQNEALHFARADILDDKFEGATPKPTLEQYRAALGMSEDDFNSIAFDLADRVGEHVEAVERSR